MKRSRLIEYIIENELSDVTFYGQVLWWSERNGNGIIKTSEGHEIYTDISVTKDRMHLKRGGKVSFKFNIDIKECACACEVEESTDYDTVMMLLGYGKELIDNGVLTSDHFTCDRLLIEALSDEKFDRIENLISIYYKAENFLHESLERYFYSKRNK